MGTKKCKFYKKFYGNYLIAIHGYVSPELANMENVPLTQFFLVLLLSETSAEWLRNSIRNVELYYFFLDTGILLVPCS